MYYFHTGLNTVWAICLRKCHNAGTSDKKNKETKAQCWAISEKMQTRGVKDMEFPGVSKK